MAGVRLVAGLTRLTGEKEDRTEHGLDNSDDQAAVDDKLRQLGGPLVRVAPVPEQKLGKI